MKSYKLEEKLFLSKSIISNVHSMRLKSRFVDNSDNETLVNESVELAVLMLEKRNLLFGEYPKKENVKKEATSIDFEEIITVFNEVCSDLPVVLKITKSRQNALIKILENYTTQDIGLVFHNVSKSDYLRGLKKGCTWKANFDWVIQLNNFVKILEGNYANTNPVNPPIEKEQMFGRMTQSTVEKNFQTFLNAYPDGK
jgi:hypothetical protein